MIDCKLYGLAALLIANEVRMTRADISRAGDRSHLTCEAPAAELDTAGGSDAGHVRLPRRATTA